MKTPVLTHNGAFPWHRNEKGVSFKGFVFDERGLFLSGEKALSLFSGVASLEQLAERLETLDGCFSVCIDHKGGYLLGMDAIRMFPLFYTWDKNTWKVGDDPELILPKDVSFNEAALPEFLSAGFVTGDETLARDIKQTMAGEAIELLPEGRIQRTFTHRFLPTRWADSSPEQLKQQGQQVLENVSKRLSVSLEGRTAILPLSGGYDSRLIACMLRRMNHPKVICFTYGKPSQESALSQKVAKQLGFEWIFIDYRHLDHQSYLFEKTFLDYADHCGHFSSMPFLQEYFAVKHLKDQGLIPSDSIFIPGHTGDFLGGSYVEKTARIPSKKTRSQHLASTCFSFQPMGKKEKLHTEARIEKWFAEYPVEQVVESPPYDVFTEDWELREKISKFIFNSSGVFPFFGYQYRFPLWDREMRTFFRQIPFVLRSEKRLYNELLETLYFKPMGVYFGAKELKETPWQRKRHHLLQPFRALMPKTLRRVRMERNDYLCYHKLVPAMEAQMSRESFGNPGLPNNYNAVICRWYAMRVKERLNYSLMRPS